jgi:hypothetical protein
MNNLAAPKGRALAKRFLDRYHKRREEQKNIKTYKATDICPCTYEESRTCQRVCGFGA